MRVRWTRNSVDDLQNLRICIEQDKPGAAKKFVQKIICRVEEDLVLQPGMGRPGRKPGTREFIITGTSYLLPYRVHDDTLIILRVLDGAMQWPG